MPDRGRARDARPRTYAYIDTAEVFGGRSDRVPEREKLDRPVNAVEAAILPEYATPVVFVESVHERPPADASPARYRPLSRGGDSPPFSKRFFGLPMMD
jgi:hypothetical protein